MLSAYALSWIRVEAIVLRKGLAVVDDLVWGSSETSEWVRT